MSVPDDSSVLVGDVGESSARGVVTDEDPFDRRWSVSERVEELCGNDGLERPFSCSRSWAVSSTKFGDAEGGSASPLSSRLSVIVVRMQRQGCWIPGTAFPCLNVG